MSITTRSHRVRSFGVIGVEDSGIEVETPVQERYMSKAPVSKLTTQLVVVGMLVALSTGAARAQKPHAAGPPITTHGQTKANDAAAKGQANAEAKRADADADKAAKTADKKEDASERAALKAAHNQPKDLLKGIKLSKPEEKSVDAIEKKYEDQLKDLDKQEDAAEKSGAPTTSIASKIATLRTQEQADLRAVLSPSQVTQFDKNATALGAKH
jgi:hypothetical protein